MTQKNLVLLGIGHTNASVVEKWAQDPISGYHLICISTFPSATYSGMLPGTLGEQFADREMRISLAPLVARAGGDLLLAHVNGLDLTGRQILFSDRDPVAFDMLSIGVGSMPAGWDEHATPSLVPIKPMQDFLTRLDERLRLAAHAASGPVRIAVVGGGAAGVEITLCLPGRLRTEFPHQQFTVELFTSESSIAGGMCSRSVRRLTQLLSERNIRLHLNQRVDQVQADRILTADGKQYPADCVIWATGAAPPPVLSKLNLQSDDRGFVATHKTLQSLSDKRIFAVGDAGTVIESPTAKAGVYAVRQSPVLWHNLRALARNEPLHEFHGQKEFLKLLNTGDGKALLEYHFLSVHARWCWRLKTWIDKRFVKEFQISRGD